MRVVRVAAAAVCCAVVVASLPAEARGGRGRSIGASRTVDVAPVRATPPYTSPQPRTSRAVFIGTGATFRPTLRGDGLRDALPAIARPIPLGAPLAAPEPHRTAHAACPTERLVGSGVGFCQVN